MEERRRDQRPKQPEKGNPLHSLFSLLPLNTNTFVQEKSKWAEKEQKGSIDDIYLFIIYILLLCIALIFFCAGHGHARVLTPNPRETTKMVCLAPLSSISSSHHPSRTLIIHLALSSSISLSHHPSRSLSSISISSSSPPNYLK